MNKFCNRQSNNGADQSYFFYTAQLYILELMFRIRSENELNEIKDVLAKYFADKALDAVDKLWDGGKSMMK